MKQLKSFFFTKVSLNFHAQFDKSLIFNIFRDQKVGSSKIQQASWCTIFFISNFFTKKRSKTISDILTAPESVNVFLLHFLLLNLIQ